MPEIVYSEMPEIIPGKEAGYKFKIKNWLLV